MIDQYLNQIIVGDALELLRTLPDESVPMFLFSPPYNMGISSGGGFLKSSQRLGHYTKDAKMNKRGGGGKWTGGQLADGYSEHHDAMAMDEYIAWQHEILRECWRCLGSGGAIFYNHKPRVFGGEVMLPTVYNPELTLRQIVIWARAGGINFAPTHYVNTHEWILVIAKPNFRLRDKSASGVGDVWYIPQQASTWHPAPFPLALATRVLETVMPSLVVDPFCGSGTTPKAAVKLGIDYIGFELSETYAKRARKEIAQVAAQPRLIPIEGKQEKMAI